MKKSLFLFVATAMAFAGCSNDEYTGTMPNGPQEGQGGAIVFSGKPGNITKAAQQGSEAAKTLDYKFNVYGAKNVGGTYKPVFAHTNAAPVDDNRTYNVWYVEGSQSTSNSTGWEYVANAPFKMPGTNNLTMNTSEEGVGQTIKYWDYAATDYAFVAYAKTIAAPAKVEDVSLDGFTATGTPDQMAALYIADKKVVNKVDYADANATPTSKAVTLKFRAAATKVRLGIYETIPGYDVTSITFYAPDSEGSQAVLSGTFPPTGETEMTVTYGDAGLPQVAWDVNNNTATTTFDFGTIDLSAADMGTTSIAPTWASIGTAGDYINVFTNTQSNAVMTLKVDYTLTNDVSGETIEVKGATAAVPAEYMKWLPNHAYTYLFKITDNTNGTTGGEGDPAGLYPITFDAVVEDVVEDENEGTITTVSQNVYVTTYAENSVSNAGITYTSGETPIYATLNADNGVLVDIAAAELYSAAGNVTEAELIAGFGVGTEVSGAAEVGNAVQILSGVVLPAGKYAKLNVKDQPEGTYYVKLTYDTDKVAYKVIKVSAATAQP